MQLYIMRHGIAVEASDWDGDDDSRPLTEEGIERTREVVEALKKDGDLAADALWSSPLTRAMQTAEIVGDVLKLKPKVVQALACGADLKSVLKAVSHQPLPDHLIWTGHEPDCGRIISELIGDPGSDYALKRAGIALLKGSFKAGGMKLVWKRQPKDILK
jgi:phosphohistidine phosphatase